MNFICFDTEDNSKELLESGKSGFDKQVTQIAVIAGNGDRYYNKGDIPAFLKWIGQRKEQFIYAHNVQYDIGNLFGDNVDILDTTLVGGRLIKSKWGVKFFYDSFNVWPMSAAKLGKAFGLDKLDTKSMATDKEYVFRDVEIIHAAMTFAWKFCEMLGIPNLPATLGGLALKVWKHFGGENCHDSNPSSRAAYYGGRVELFKPENEFPLVAYTDINSLYPYVMQGKFPGMLSDCGTELQEYGVATVDIEQPETDLGILPYRDEIGRILYPWGKFTGTWTMLEIQAAVTNGAKISKVHQCWGTNETMQPYGEFVRRLYSARLESTSEAEKLFFKLLMNNLYGRLGSSGKIGRTVWQTEKNRNDGVPFGSKVLVNMTMPLDQNTNWCHAAYVTAYGRLELLKYLKFAGIENMIYCDTDSVIFDVKNKQLPFQVGNELGVMKLVGHHKHCRTYAPKTYQIGKESKAKGVPQRLAAEFIRTGVAEFDLPFKFREAVVFFDRDNSKKLSVWRKVVKTMRAEYKKKKLIKSRFYPLQISAIAP